MPLDRNDWDSLMRSIAGGTLIPILGAGAVDGNPPVGIADEEAWKKNYQYPTNRTLANQWSLEYSYPLEDSNQFERVAQFLAVDRYVLFPKQEVQNSLQTASAPDFTIPNEPHGVLADLPLPLYMTSNYDNFLTQAIRIRTPMQREPRQCLCVWNKHITEEESNYDPGWEPHPGKPLVFHLHGAAKVPASLVVTEDDYMEFVVNLSRQNPSLPSKIEGRIAKGSLLFLGYKLTDWDFRTIFRIMVQYLRSNLGMGVHVAVQLAPWGNVTSEQEKERIKRAEKYLASYFQPLKVSLYLGTCQEFAADLKKRWGSHGNGK